MFFHSPFAEEVFALEATTVTPLPGNHSMLGLGLFLFLAVYSGWPTFSPIFCLFHRVGATVFKKKVLDVHRKRGSSWKLIEVPRCECGIFLESEKRCSLTNNGS